MLDVLKDSSQQNIEHCMGVKEFPREGLPSLGFLFYSYICQTGLLESETFNMFFISPYCAPELPVYSQIQGIVPFTFSVLFYVAGFTAASGIIMLLSNVFHISSATSLSHQTHTPKLRRLPATH